MMKTFEGFKREKEIPKIDANEKVLDYFKNKIDYIDELDEEELTFLENQIKKLSSEGIINLVSYLNSNIEKRNVEKFLKKFQEYLNEAYKKDLEIFIKNFDIKEWKFDDISFFSKTDGKWVTLRQNNKRLRVDSHTDEFKFRIYIVIPPTNPDFVPNRFNMCTKHIINVDYHKDYNIECFNILERFQKYLLDEANKQNIPIKRY